MTTRAQPLSVARKAWFTVIMLALPVLFFVFLEAGLRLAGYGNSYPLFIPSLDQPDFLTQNREVAWRYFSGQAVVPTGVADVFQAEKQSNTYRLVVQGGSSAAGYPYYYGGSFARMLQQRLQQTFPDRTIETVNTALAAVNSYTLLDFADEIVAIDPDAVLIYAGHNEYYGALGVGSAERLGRSRNLVRTYLALQKLRTAQLLRAGIARLAASMRGRQAGEAPGATLMERMVGEQRIPLDSELFRQGIHQFEGNLGALLERYTDAGIPVYLATIASNERDHAPFESSPRADTDIDAYRSGIAEARRLSSAGDTLTALRTLEDLLTLDDSDAEAMFLKARLLDRPGTTVDARQAYVRAKDLDQLRFRAPEQMNEVIRAASTRAGVQLVDAQSALREASDDGIIDSSLMLEHLHPNADGYFLIADAFYEALRADQAIGTWDLAVPRAIAKRERLLTEVDSLFGVFRLRQLMGSWPFAAPGVVDQSMDAFVAETVPEELALELFRRETSWFDATRSLRSHYMQEGNLHLALKASLAIIQQFPYVPLAYALAGDVLLRQRRGREALAYYEAAVEREDSAPVRVVMGDVHAAMGQHGDAADAYRYAVRLAPKDADASLKLGRSLVLVGDTVQAVSVLQDLLVQVPGEPRALRALEVLSDRP